MNDKIKKFLDASDFRFLDVDENGNEKEMTLSQTFESSMQQNFSKIFKH